MFSGMSVAGPRKKSISPSCGQTPERDDTAPLASEHQCGEDTVRLVAHDDRCAGAPPEDRLVLRSGGLLGFRQGSLDFEVDALRLLVRLRRPESHFHRSFCLCF